MIWWQTLLLALAPAALTAAALLLQSMLTRRHESARHWADARLSAHAELWQAFHSILEAVDDEAEAARDVDPDTRLTVALSIRDADRLSSLRERCAAAWLLSTDRTRERLLAAMGAVPDVLDLRGRETTAGRLVEICDAFSKAFDDYATAARGELSVRT